MIKTHLFDTYTEIIHKKSLNGMDTKRYILPNYIDTLPHGHDKIKTIKSNPVYEEINVANHEIKVNTYKRKEFPQLDSSSGDDDSDNDYYSVVKVCKRNRRKLRRESNSSEDTQLYWDLKQVKRRLEF